MDLDPRSVGGEQVHGHAPLLPGDDGLVAVGGQRDLDDPLSGFPGPLGNQHQPLRRFARFHASRAFPSAGMEACAVLATAPQVALDLAVPAGQTRGIGERRPHVVDIGVEAVFHAHDALAVC